MFNTAPFQIKILNRKSSEDADLSSGTHQLTAASGLKTNVHNGTDEMEPLVEDDMTSDCTSMLQPLHLILQWKEPDTFNMQLLLSLCQLYWKDLLYVYLQMETH